MGLISNPMKSKRPSITLFQAVLLSVVMIGLAMFVADMSCTNAYANLAVTEASDQDNSNGVLDKVSTTTTSDDTIPPGRAMRPLQAGKKCPGGGTPQKHGGDHGWTTCYSSELRDKESCVIYGFGVGQYLEWDLAMAKTYPNCNVYSFDPTPTALQHMFGAKQTVQKLLSNHFFVPLGLSHESGMVTLFAPAEGDQFTREFRQARNGDAGKINIPVQTVEGVMAGLGHTYLDILKVDIEGGEFPVLEQLHKQGTLNNVGQFMYEGHFFKVNADRKTSPELKRVEEIMTYHGFHKIADAGIRFYMDTSLTEASFAY